MNEELNDMINNDILEKNSFSNKNVMDLYILVDDYVKETGICIGLEFGKYFIKQNNVGFEVGVDYGPDLFYYIRRIDTDELEDFIDTTHIYNKVVPVRQAIIKNEFMEINERIKDLEEKGLSKKLIRKYIKL